MDHDGLNEEIGLERSARQLREQGAFDNVDEEEDQEEIRLRVIISPEEEAIRLFAINHPHRKRELFSRRSLSTCRFKQNVGLLEVNKNFIFGNQI